MHNFVRVKLQNGSEASVPAGFAASHDLKPLKKPAANSRGRALPATHPEAEVEGYDSLTVSQLRDQIKARNDARGPDATQISTDGNKPDLVKALEADDISQEEQ